MLKILTIIALALFPVISFATESTEVKCNSGNDCFDKSWYLADQKKDFEKSFKYAKKGCDQYNHGESCVLSVIWLYKIQNKTKLSDSELQEQYAKPAELGVPGAIMVLYKLSPAFRDFASHIKNGSMEEFYHSSNAVDKLLELNKVFLKVCTIQSKLEQSSDERENKYFQLSRAIIRELTQDLYLKWRKHNTKFLNAEGVDMSVPLYIGFEGIRDGDCYGLKEGIKLLNEFKKYEDL